MGGISAYELRLLCDDPWEGGRGQSLHDVMNMTLDQIVFLLCDRNLLKYDIGSRQKTMGTYQAYGKVRKADGTVYGRTAEGDRIKGKIRGKSKARRLMEEEAERLKAERAAKADQQRKRRKRKSR